MPRIVNTPIFGRLGFSLCQQAEILKAVNHKTPELLTLREVCTSCPFAADYVLEVWPTRAALVAAVEKCERDSEISRYKRYTPVVRQLGRAAQHES